MPTKPEDSPRANIADLAAYNAGELHGEWVELDEDFTAETIQKVPERWQRYLDLGAYALDLAVEGTLWTIELGAEGHAVWNV